MSTSQTIDRRIHVNQIASETFLPIPKCLIYTEKYRELDAKAAFLYGLLRDKYKLSERTTKSQQENEKPLTYVDSEGYIYCIFDNAEIEFTLKISEPIAIKLKKQLQEVGLLAEVRQKHGANRIYVLNPEVNQGNDFDFNAELKQYRIQKSETLAKRKQGLKNIKSNNKDLNNFSPQGLKKFKGTNTNSFNTKKDFSKYVSNLSPQSVIDFYNVNFKSTNYAKDQLPKACKSYTDLLVFEAIKRAIIGEAGKPIAYIKSTAKKWFEAGCKTEQDIILYEEEFYSKKQAKEKNPRRGAAPVRKELTPDWLDEERKQHDGDPQEDIDYDAVRRKIEERRNRMAVK